MKRIYDIKPISRPVVKKQISVRKRYSIVKVAIVLVAIATLCYMIFQPKKVTVTPTQALAEEPAERSLSPKQEIVKKIVDTFPEQPITMVAIAMQESSLNPKAISYNCYYKGYWSKGKPIITDPTPLKEKTKGVISWFCKQGHEQYAWSKDGGLMQIHQPDSNDLNIDENLREAREKYDTQGITAWSSYNLGHYKRHIAMAQKLVSELSTTK